MDFFNDRINMRYDGFYRAEIKEVMDLKNGLYKVKIYPFFYDIDDVEKLPVAMSNLTNKYSHISLEVGDWVWVFFDNGCINNPVIFDLCNVKDSYPKSASGEKPDYYDNIVKDNEIDENEVKYNGEYNKFNSFYFGDIKIDFDMKNKQIILYSDNWYIVLDSDKGIHIKGNSCFIKGSEKLGVNFNNNIINMDSDGIDIKNNKNVEILLDDKVLVKNSVANLNGLLKKLDEVIEGLKDDVLAIQVTYSEQPCTVTFSPVKFTAKDIIFKNYLDSLIKEG